MRHTYITRNTRKTREEYRNKIRSMKSWRVEKIPKMRHYCQSIFVEKNVLLSMENFSHTFTIKIQFWILQPHKRHTPPGRPSGRRRELISTGGWSRTTFKTSSGPSSPNSARISAQNGPKPPKQRKITTIEWETAWKPLSACAINALSTSGENRTVPALNHPLTPWKTSPEATKFYFEGDWPQCPGISGGQ